MIAMHLHNKSGNLLHTIFVGTALLLPGIGLAQSNILVSTNGKVKFMSDAPLEIIEAHTDKLKGAIDQSKNTFAFSVEIKSLKGFNGELQKEHFHENYLETEKFPTATFSGKFIEQIDYATNGTYGIRAKGILSIHGIQKERIIKGKVTVNNGNIQIDAAFTVRLEDHDIKVPKIVYSKIAEEMKVDFNIQFKQ